MTIPAGTLVPRDARDFGSYQLIAKLATGGMAEIFLARIAGNTNPKDVIVLKRILPHLAEDEHFVSMFRDEADLASQLIHKNVCQVHAFGEVAGTWFIAMEYLHGVPLSRMMTRLSKAGKMLDLRVVAGIICQACEGLHAAHNARGNDGHLLNVVHRDVSPPNMMVCGDGMVKLLDFGIAKARGANSRTRTGTVKGKNAYMSPEQILGKPLDRRSDVFALAIVMYELLSIKRLFHRDSDFLTFKAITEEPIPDIKERRPDLPAAMRAALTQAMARDPNGRFDTALAFGSAVRNAVKPLGGPSSPEELAKLLFSDFADEMAARDEILKAADEPAPPPKAPPRPASKSKPPPLPPALRSGEFSPVTSSRGDDTEVDVGPSMIIASSDTPPLPAGVLDLSSTVPADSWVHNPDTDLLWQHRKRSLRNVIILLLVLIVACAGAVVLVTSVGGDPDSAAIAMPPPADAAVREPPKPDASTQMSRDDITALSRFGFLTLKANAKTTIFVDGKLVGETPLDKVPITPGPHKIKAVGPKNKNKQFDVTIYGGKEADEGELVW